MNAGADAPGRAAKLARDYEAIRADETIQYAPIVAEPGEPPPEWLRSVQEFLAKVFNAIGGGIGDFWPVLKWILLAIAIAAAIAVILSLKGKLPSFRRKGNNAPEEQEWKPPQHEAMALLEDADRLAAEGRYGEATHLLLRRSIGHIADTRPEWLDPSSTAREITRLPQLPRAASAAFAAIAQRVERSLFALRQLDADDWRVARAAYADFALERLDGQAAS